MTILQQVQCAAGMLSQNSHVPVAGLIIVDKFILNLNFRKKNGQTSNPGVHTAPGAQR
jgi:hypothetical protein